MEKEWTRKGKKHFTKLESKFNRMEWKWNGQFSGVKIGGLCGRNGKEMECKFFLQNKWKQILM